MQLQESSSSIHTFPYIPAMQCLWSGSLYLLPHWDPRDGACSHLSLYTHLPCVPHCHPGELHHSFSKIRGLSAWACVRCPLHTCFFLPSTVHLLISNNAENLLQCHWNFSPDVCFAQEFFIHGFSATESSVFFIMSINLQPSGIHLHYEQCQSH